MNEDLKPIYDFEADWKPCNSGNDKRIIFMNNKRNSLFRIIDMQAETISYSDVDRVTAIKDINKVLVKENDEEENKRRFLPLVNKVIDEVIPIYMPYVPETYTCYIEAFPGFDENYEDTIGILYFRKDTDKATEDMIPVKRFFRIHQVASAVRYEEIDFNTYHNVNVKWMKRMEEKDVDKA